MGEEEAETAEGYLKNNEMKCATATAFGTCNSNNDNM